MPLCVVNTNSLSVHLSPSAILSSSWPCLVRPQLGHKPQPQVKRVVFLAVLSAFSSRLGESDRAVRSVPASRSKSFQRSPKASPLRKSQGQVYVEQCA